MAKEGYDLAYGARPLKRVIQKLILDPLALDLLGGKFAPRDTILGTADGDDLVFRKA